MAVGGAGMGAAIGCSGGAAVGSFLGPVGTISGILLIAGDLTEKYGRKFYGDWSFFRVTNSEYIKWISEKSCTYADEFTFIHFSIVGSDEIIDVLSRYEPTVRFVEEEVV